VSARQRKIGVRRRSDAGIVAIEVLRCDFRTDPSIATTLDQPGNQATDFLQNGGRDVKSYWNL